MDFISAVKKNDEWIFFECKVENLYESDYLKTRNSFFLELKSQINNNFSNLRIDFWNKTELEEKDIHNIVDGVKQKFKEKVFGCQIDIYGNTFILNQLSDDIKLKNVIRVYPSYLGVSEKKRISNLINKANKQIPSTNKGIIIIKSYKFEFAESVAREKINRANFNNIIAIVIIAMGKGKIFINPNNQDFPREFLNITISKPIPAFFC
ncbi:hypothetical protein LCGC14_0560800 [marine sediment metagenome]|uniref:Uncharacterized protein n=1 Tax=marine sediment metagenome TaxID=412755 RepID=A0A0F9U8L0_9ZZZZ